MTTTDPRDALAEIVYRVNNPRHGDYGSHQETADAILAAGWRPPQPPTPEWQVNARVREARATSLGYCEHVVEVLADGEEETCSELREHGSVLCAEHQPPPSAPSVEVDAEADAWYVRVLDDDVHHTTENVPANLDWTRDGQLIGIELLAPLRRDQPVDGAVSVVDRIAGLCANTNRRHMAFWLSQVAAAIREDREWPALEHKPVDDSETACREVVDRG